MGLLAFIAALAGCAQPAVHGDGDVTVVAFGDSYTSGTGAKTDEAYPARLAEALNLRVVNAGIHGQTAEEALPRLQRDVLDREPDLVVVEFGVNEAFRGYPVARAEAGLDALMGPIHQAGIPMVLVGVHFADYQENFDEALERLAAKYDAALVLDVLDGILSNPELRSDRYHPNAAGYALMEERIRPAVSATLAKTPQI